MGYRTIREIRLENARVLQERVGGQKGMMVALDCSQSQVSALMGARAFKKIGDRMARRIEQAFSMPHGWLDRDFGARTNVDDLRREFLLEQIERLAAEYYGVSAEDLEVISRILVSGRSLEVRPRGG